MTGSFEAWDMLVTTLVESIPPERNAPSGTSAIISEATTLSTHSRISSRPAGSRRPSVGRSQ